MEKTQCLQQTPCHNLACRDKRVSFYYLWNTGLVTGLEFPRPPLNYIPMPHTAEVFGITLLGVARIQRCPYEVPNLCQSLLHFFQRLLYIFLNSNLLKFKVVQIPL